ncbi:MAG: putative PEP-binding protein, partial [Bacillota bacterium]
RTNERVSGLYDSMHPAVLRLVADVIRAGRAAGRWVGMCGELAGDPLAVPILLGLGLEEFSMSPPALPRVKEVLRSLTLPEAQAVAQEALHQPDAQAVRRLIRERFPQTAG